MDPTLWYEQRSRPAYPPTMCSSTRTARVAPGRAVTTPASVARRCDHIIRLIDELLAAPDPRAGSANTLAARRRSPRREPARGAGMGGDDVAR
ncbi:MAG TPA: hypothetical protein VFH48_09710 [Chloroflexota bacterium]|nr:hypothetical protein [Chloroflexota bacterium]